jgi:Na+:H+ antiporter, NhaA family
MQPLSVPPTDADHVLGRLDAPKIIVEYGDYDCPHTRRAHHNLKLLLAEAEGAVALVFRHFPLRHLHQNAQKLAELMQAVTDPEQFWAAHDRLMAQRHMSLEVAEQELSALGLSLVELALQGTNAALAVQTDVERGLADGVHSTPSFFFNGAPHDGKYDVDTLRQQLANAPER